jgi:hypothetical protein
MLEPKQTRRLRMTFETEDGPWTLSISDVKEGLIPEEVESVMQTIVDNNIFGIPPTAIVKAELVETGTTQLV